MAKKEQISSEAAPVGASLSAADIEYFRTLLISKRQEILHNVHEIQGEALKQSRQDAAGDLSCMPVHMADLGTDAYEQEFALGLMDSERKLLKEIDEALARVDEGKYGVCIKTGHPISMGRLKAMPWARYCVEYARQLEENGGDH